jgi:DNA (cytosine-5)-methyltransferase 1
MKVISTFSGAGGSSLGLKQAGFKIPVALEFVESAAESYRLNGGDTLVLGDDIRDVDPVALMDAAGVKVGELDVFEGSPPCDSFSMAGSREKAWGVTKKYYEGKKQRVDDLVFVFLGLAEKIKPRAILMENVEGLARGKARLYLDAAVRQIKAMGYSRVDARIYDGADYGLPQRRRRLVLVALRDDVAGEYVVPEVTHPRGSQVSIRQALVGVPEATGQEIAKTLTPGTKGLDMWNRTKQGQGFDVAYKKLFGTPSMFNQKRCDGGKVSFTIAKTPCVHHHAEPRLFHIPELRRLAGFPDDFKIVGSHAQRWGRIGMSVAPPMYRAIGGRLMEALSAEPYPTEAANADTVDTV